MRKENVKQLLAKYGVTLDKWQSTKAGKFRLQLGRTVMRVQEKVGNKWVPVYSAYFANLKVRETRKGTELGPFDRYGEYDQYDWFNLDAAAK